jgi:hypothetical protein
MPSAYGRLNTRLLVLSATMLAAALAVSAVACGGNNDKNGGTITPTTQRQGTPPAGATVNVNLTEFRIIPDTVSVSAGPVTFDAKNIGSADHEMVILKTDLAETALPMKDDGSVDEAGAGVEAIDEIGEFAPQGEESLTVNLEAGNYVLICNIVQQSAAGETVNHFAEGMHTAFTVTE